MKFIKNHKILTALFIMLIMFVIAFIILYNMLFVYTDDNRLNGKKEIEINEASRKTIIENIKKNDEVKDVNINIVANLISLVVDVNKDTKKDKSKELSNKILEEFSDKEKEYYDVQIMVKCTKCNADDTTYPIIGYKNKKNKKLVWSNN